MVPNPKESVQNIFYFFVCEIILPEHYTCLSNMGVEELYVCTQSAGRMFALKPNEVEEKEMWLEVRLPPVKSSGIVFKNSRQMVQARIP